MKVVIPARFASTRLPGKPLADIAGKPMIWHVWQRGVEAVGADNCWVATDHSGVRDIMTGFGAQVVMTAPDHVSGTDRIAEVAVQLNWADDDIVVNVQGDEPLLPPALVTQVGSLLANTPNAGISTLGCPITKWDDLLNPNIVKAVCDKEGMAHYFSRSPVPYDRSGEQDASRYPYLRHIGIYAYRVSTLKQLQTLEEAPTEKLESLEQLRALWHGINIVVGAVVDAPPHGVDTPEDLAAVRQIVEG